MILAYGTIFGVASLTFWQSGETLLSVVICVVYLAMFFGVPILMVRVRNAHDGQWNSAHDASQSDRVTVFSGTLGRKEALLQIVLVPLAVSIAFSAFALIWLSVQP